MANWFGTSTGLFKGRASDTPQPFEIDCECGQRHTGMRRQQHQRIICRACGTALFILPKDVYPASTESIPVSSAKRWTESDDDVAQLVEIEEPESAPAKRKSTAKPDRQPATRKPPDPPKSPPAPQPLPAPQPARAKNTKPQGPFWTPLKFVTIAMIAIVAVTLFLVVRAQQQEDARRQLASAVEEFNKAISNRDWAQARNQINQVVESLDVLGRDDASARRHRQFHKEITAMNDLARSSLFEILEESDANHTRDPSDWKMTFETQHAGRWLVMELPARRGARIEPPGDGSRRRSDDEEPSAPRYHYEFDFPITIGPNARPVKIEMSIAALDRLAWDESGRSVVAAAQLSDLELSADRSHWIVTFDPDTSFLWGNIETYEGLGFTFAEWNPREQTQALLDEQAVAIGIQEVAPGATPATTEVASRTGDHE